MSTPLVLVTGANGLVGARVCAALLERGATVRALVRRAGTAPSGTEEVVGDFTSPDDARRAVEGAEALVTTVHPMGSDRETQQRVGVEGTTTIARAAAEGGLSRHVHVSTAAVYDRSPRAGDVDESSALVGDDGNDYAVTKRDTDAAVAAVDGTTRVLLRPPAILGAGDSSVWNTLRPQEMREDPSARHTVADATFAWVHVADLADLAAGLAAGQVDGPEPGACTVANVAAAPATQRDYYACVTGALGVDPVWDDEPGWTGAIVADRARSWGWRPTVELAAALAEIEDGLTSA